MEIRVRQVRQSHWEVEMGGQRREAGRGGVCEE